MNTERATELMDTAPDYLKATAQLFAWSLNYNYPTPATLYLDLIGWSEEEGSGRLCGDKMPALGCLEIDLLANALKEYANRPQDVSDFVTALIYSDQEDGN